jgi:hypothetical protein
MATYPVPQPPPKRFVLLSTILYFLSWIVSNWFKSRARQIRTKFIFGSTLVDNEVGKAIYVDILPEALAEGQYLVAPDPYVVRKGLEYIQAGFDFQKRGVSAKVVVSL